MMHDLEKIFGEFRLIAGWSFVNEKWTIDDLEVTNLKKGIIPKQIEYTQSSKLF